jgi:hypothetical protein
MIKTLMAAAITAAFALPLLASAQSDTGASARQPGVNPPGAASPGSPSSSVTGTDRDSGAAARTNPSASGTTASGFDRLDRNHDGFVSRDEARDASELNTRFTELDKNNDGKLSRDEYNVVNRGSAGASAAPSSSGSTDKGVQGASGGGTK